MKVSIPDELLAAQYVFVRHDGHRTPLQRHCDGHYEVILPGSKTIRIRAGDREEIIAIDRLNTDNTDPDTQVTVAHLPVEVGILLLQIHEMKLIGIYL